MGNNGDLVVVWTDYTDDSLGDILSRERPRSSGAWSETLNLSLTPRRDSGPALYRDSQGLIHLAWTSRDQELGSDLIYRQRSDGIWSDPVILDQTSTFHPTPYNLVFAEDITGTLWLFVNIGSGIRHARLQDGVWDPLSEWVTIPGLSGLATIVGGADGSFHVAAFGQNEGNLGPWDPYFRDGYYTTITGDTWGDLHNLTYTGTIAYDIELLFDEQGNLRFLWSDSHSFYSEDSEKAAVYERTRVDDAWGDRVEVTVDNTDQAVLDLSLAKDALGQLHLVWSEGLFDDRGVAVDLSIRYRCWSGAWRDEEVVFYSSADSLNAALSLNHFGEPAVVWEEGSAVAEEVFFSERQLLLAYHVYLPLVDSFLPLR
jgi:hypothetical protein